MGDTVKKLLFLAVTTLPAAEVPVQVAAEMAVVQGHREANQFVLEVADPGNHAWRLQTSDHLGTWTNGATYRVFNGLLRIPMPIDGSQRFFRLNSDEAGEVATDADAALLLPATPFNYANPPLPPHLRAPVILAQDNTPANNVTTNAGATLGRALFYDKRLSANQTVSCSSCHQSWR